MHSSSRKQYQTTLILCHLGHPQTYLLLNNIERTTVKHHLLKSPFPYLLEHRNFWWPGCFKIEGTRFGKYDAFWFYLVISIHVMKLSLTLGQLKFFKQWRLCFISNIIKNTSIFHWILLKISGVYLFFDLLMWGINEMSNFKSPLHSVSKLCHGLLF